MIKTIKYSLIFSLGILSISPDLTASNISQNNSVKIEVLRKKFKKTKRKNNKNIFRRIFSKKGNDCGCPKH